MLNKVIFGLLLFACVAICINAQKDDILYEPTENACDRCNCIAKEQTTSRQTFVLNCAGKGLTQILNGYPDLYPTDRNDVLIDVSFSGNDIKYLKQLPANPAILSFSCRNCKLTEIASAAFIDMANIFKIDLSWNSLTGDVLRADIFRGRYNDQKYEPINLLELDLSHNKIVALDRNIFEHTTKLRRLSLAYNSFKIFEPGTLFALASLQSIVILDLSYTELNDIPDEMFERSKVATIEELYLQGNKLTKIPESLAILADSLNLLHIGNNSLKTLDDESFFGLKNIRNLYINEMDDLETIEPGTFTSMKSLQILHINDNINLTELSLNSLVGAEGLLELDISNCSLYTMDVVDYDDNSTKVVFPKLRKFNIENNPWLCNCVLLKSLVPIKAFNHSEFRSDNSKARCSMPYDMASDLLIDLSIDTLCAVTNNKKPPRTVAYDRPAFLRPRAIVVSLLSVLSVIVIGLFIGFAIVLIKKKFKENDIGFSQPIRYTTVRNSTMSDVVN